MNLWHKIGLMTIAEHNTSVQRNVDEMNKYMSTELEKRSLMVDETLGAIAHWESDVTEIHSDPRVGVKIILEAPRSMIIGMVRAEPEIAGFVLSRITYLLKAAIQRSLQQIMGRPAGGEETTGSYI